MLSIFQDRVKKFQNLSDLYRDRSTNLSWLRIISFLLFAAILIIFIRFELYLISILFLVLFFFVFGMLVKKHQRARYKKDFYKTLSKINQEEIQRLKLDLSKFETGEKYLFPDHPYAYDLDIFGQHSIYQLVSRCTTDEGKNQLAKDLLIHQNPREIKNRHAAIKELKDKLDWRQNLESYGRTNVKKEKSNFAVFLEWIQSSERTKNLNLLIVIMAVVWILILITSYFVVIGSISFLWLFSFLFISASVLGPKLKTMQNLTTAMIKVQDELNARFEMIRLIEKESFANEYLRNLQSKFIHHSTNSSHEIKRLRRIVDLFVNRGNMFYALVNSFFMLDILFLYLAEKWKHNNKNEIEIWFQTLGCFETLFSYTAFSYSHPGFDFPTISESEVCLMVKNIGHPLIDESVRVNNDFEMNGVGSSSLITGSNMAGKSTFLRAIGVNLILAQCGMPVCAEKMDFYPCEMFSSMRTKDNLKENVSTFYAELIRIRSLIQTLNDKKLTFYLLDEILKGTNSHDRHKGAVTLIEQLSRSNAIGLVSTHDLELQTLTQTNPKIKNYSFNSSIVNNEIFFDYKLQKGACTSFNAIELMKKMGIDIK